VDAFSTIFDLGVRDLVDILVVAVLIYYILLLVKGTRGLQITLGVMGLLVVYYLARSLELQMVETLFSNFFVNFILAAIIIYQQEIRRGLAALGRGRFFRPWFTSAQRANLEGLMVTVAHLSRKKTGALMVLEREIGLRNYIETGIKLDALLGHDLLVSIFTPACPLHDGAVIVQADRIAAAGCYLPLTTSPEPSRRWGSRHRAGLGISEETDAISIIVSEETGRISIAFQGNLIQDLEGPKLLALLRELMGTRRSPSAQAAQRSPKPA
jgi:diadenylate cyclase